MNIVTSILLRCAEITTVLVGITGFALSTAILFSPAGVRRMSARLNRQVHLRPNAEDLNRQVSLDAVLGWFPFVSGSIITGSALAVLIFLVFTPMPTYSDRVLLSIGFESLLLLAQLASVLGMCFGLTLMFAPEWVKRINQTLNRWHDADAVIRRMEQRVYDFDGWILNNPRASGVIGLALSVALLAITFSQL